MFIRRWSAVAVVLLSTCLLLLYWNAYNLIRQVLQTTSSLSKDSSEDDAIRQQQVQRTLGNTNELNTHLFGDNDVDGGTYDDTKRINSNKTQSSAQHVANSFKETKVPAEVKPNPGFSEREEPSAQMSEPALREQRWNEALASCANQTKERRLPDIIGIGTEKCGTHALNQFLSYHPLIRINENQTEAHYFGGRKANLGLDYYRSLMPEAEKCAFVMEKTPAYFSFPPEEIPQIMKKSVPNAKLLLILCDPVKRAFSDFVHEWVLKNLGFFVPGLSSYDEIEKYLNVYLPLASKKIRPLNDTQSLEDSKEILQWHQADYISSILTTGLYAHHLKRWLRFYNETNLMIIDGEELFQDPGGVIEKVQEFLGIPKLILRSDFVKDPNTGYYCYREWINEKVFCLPSSKQRTRGGKRKLKLETLLMLKMFYQSHNEDLFKLLGRRFNWQ